MLKAYKYRLYPNKSQIEILWKTINGCRYVYNWSLEQRQTAYKNGEKMPSVFDLNKKLTVMKQDNQWLYDCSCPALQFSIRNMDSAYTNFYRRVKEGKKKEELGFPKFKSRHNPVQSFQMINNYRIDFENKKIKLPKISTWVKCVLDREFLGTMKTGTVSVTNTGKWFVSILVEDETELPDKVPYTDDQVIGIDLGLTHFAILSDGTKIENPRFLRESEKRLACLQRRLSKKQKGSQNKKKAALKVALQYEKVKNQRMHFLHCISSKLVNENPVLVVEDLNVKGMVKNKYLSKSISDVSWSEFTRQLEYKSEWTGKTVIKIGRFEPTSKGCSVCGYKYEKMSLSVRLWQCPKCGTKHDRDINAAQNIKALGTI